MEKAATVDRETLRSVKPQVLRNLIRKGEWRSHTMGLSEGHVQANLAILPYEFAFDFLVFCQRNPKPCPVLAVTDRGSPEVRDMAPGSDLRTDLSRYRIFEEGECIAEAEDVSEFWRDDLVGFLLGCSATFERSLLQANIRLRHLEQGVVPPVYVSGIQCVPAGPFSGPMVVSMRPIRRDQVPQAVLITSRYPATHGGPIHMGDPAAIGISDLEDVVFGEPLLPQENEVPVFWACGITPQWVALNAKPDLMITHYAGHLFVTDVLADEIATG
jgi:uncharacterized protein YcsI (UPF0317 family)